VVGRFAWCGGRFNTEITENTERGIREQKESGAFISFKVGWFAVSYLSAVFLFSVLSVFSVFNLTSS
jgi:hypothetical protein